VGAHKNCYKKGSQRSNRPKKKYRRKKGLRIWNEEIKNAIETNKQLTKNTYKTLVKKILKHTK
jgi:hypothetical protein